MKRCCLVRIGILCVFGMIVQFEAQQTRAEQPNIILIVADDLGYGDIGCYGNKKNRTPHLDRLAAEGMRFTDFHSNGPMCTPTRAALLTGLYQHRFGRAFESALSYKAHRDRGLPLEARTIADVLKPAGYATAMYGKWHLGYGPPFVPTRQGFDEFRGLLTGDGDHHSHISRSGNEDWWADEEIDMEDGYTAELITQHSIDFVQRSQISILLEIAVFSRCDCASRFARSKKGLARSCCHQRDSWFPARNSPRASMSADS